MLMLVFLNGFNLMQLAFIESFQVANVSGEDVTIMPVGMREGSGKYAPLPRYRNAGPPAVRLNVKTPISLQSGEIAPIAYDYDDINFRCILVRDSRGATYILDTDKKGTKSSCYGPQKSRYAIPPLKQLRPVPVELLPCFDGEAVSYSGAAEFPD
jgi:hypothetical protein